jgi:hypothetical protein
MAETAAHWVDHVIPPLSVRQWVLSVPKRLRWYLEREPQALSAVLRILRRVIEAHLIQGSGAGARARFGAVSFIHRFGASLNRPVHDHCCLIDGVFEPVDEADDGPQAVRFRAAAELTPQAVTAITDPVRIQVLRWFARSGLLERDDVGEMRAWANSGFSLDAEVRVGAQDRAGLERLLRDCARPPFALKRLERRDADHAVYRLPKPQRDRTTALTLTPRERIDHLAALLPPPRRHRHCYHGVLATNAPLRAAAIAFGREEAEPTDSPSAVRSPPPMPAPRRVISGSCGWPGGSSRCAGSVPRAAQTCA